LLGQDSGAFFATYAPFAEDQDGEQDGGIYGDVPVAVAWGIRNFSEHLDDKQINSFLQCASERIIIFMKNVCMDFDSTGLFEDKSKGPSAQNEDHGRWVCIFEIDYVTRLMQVQAEQCASDKHQHERR